MNKNSFLIALTVVFFVSCDSDFNELGTNIVGVDNFNQEKISNGVTAVNQETRVPESTNLPINPLGIYDNPVFGLTTANFATQIELGTENPEFDPALLPYIQSVVLTVPYFNTKESTDTDGAGTYSLDSIYGPDPATTKMKLSVYESGYFIRDLNPVDQLTQSYYTDQDALFDNAKVGNRLNNDSEAQNDKFFFDKAESLATVKTYASSTLDSVSTTVRTVPAMKLNLSKDFFITKIVNAPAGKLLNNNVFKDYFRGLYFKVEQSGSDAGNLAMLNFRAGKITITYREYASVPDSDPVTPLPLRVTKTLLLNFTGKSVSLINQASPNVIPDNEKLVLKGGANGSMAVIDLFNGTQLNDLRNNNLLINDATLTFTIAKDIMNTGATKAVEPSRLYLYDLNNKRALLDYTFDTSVNASKPKFGKAVYGGIIKKDSDGRGTTYKIRITKHIMNLVKQDTVTNVRLGLVVKEGIPYSPTNKKIKTPVLDGKIKVIPLMTAIHPLGTVLFGSNIPEGSQDYDKRPKFEIYYTKP